MNERGTIKWTSLMLPEHVEMLRSLWAEDEKQSKPIIDDQELEVISLVVSEAWEQGKPVKLIVFRQSSKLVITGKITAIKPEKQLLTIRQNGENYSIGFSEISRAEITH
ncbi:YolD-like family protein [Sediminibacillus albus]|uniref:YolD-like protein n=1 Tax=Sediminibacillus albus TaxID=407036 RepID=A0A1G8VTK1_9BACI|nr:YolD-like family protein [Sediminibacillus albus]SDJ68530.1 YolD-like protein [Sediminibacillus albus]